MIRSRRTSNLAPNASDLASQVHILMVRASRLSEIVIKLADGASSHDLSASDGQDAAEDARRGFEASIQDLRSLCADALGTPGSIDGSVPSLVVAIRDRVAENDLAAGMMPANPLTVAMRRVDQQDAAERDALAAAHTARLRTPASLDDYQGSFHSSAVA